MVEERAPIILSSSRFLYPIFLTEQSMPSYDFGSNVMLFLNIYMSLKVPQSGNAGTIVVWALLHYTVNAACR